MSSTHNLPRRRPATTSSVDNLSDSMQSISLLRKGATFQVPSKPDSELLDPFLRGLSLPKLPSRSPTCPKALEDLLIGAGERRAVDLLKRVDDAIARRAELSSILSEPEVLPVPRFMVENADAPPAPSTRRSSIQSVEDDRDSGIGSSISSPTTESLDKMDIGEALHSYCSPAPDTYCQPSVANNNTKTTTVPVTSSNPGNNETKHVLSEFAQKQIHKFIIQPILREQSLKEFHALIRDVPNKIGSKEIRTLRDLEKTLIFLAPDFSRTPALYRSFCETSIRCLHLTVNGVHESDRCLPTDRPYTTNYFLDLVEQIRRYASILAATREKQARGETLDEMDATPTDRVELKGGMTHNGKPAFLTRVRDSKHISLADDKQLSPEDMAASTKRHMEDEGCTKQFKRPCDLTKHHKTHERPFKCPEADCKYHEVGWPTEKECERHVNDKHSNAPTMYRCMQPGCPYTSKRESNCKQHMEKAHNIPYVRSKNNGKGKAAVAVTRIPKYSPAMQTDSAVGSPFSPPALSPSVNSIASGESAAQGVSSAPSIAPEFNFDFGAEFSTHFNTDYLNPSPSIPVTPTWTEDRRVSTTTSVTNYSPFEMQLDTFDPSILKTEDYDFGMFSEQNQSLMQESLFQGDFDKFSGMNQQHVGGSADLANFSPCGQDQTLNGFNSAMDDSMMMDDGFHNTDFQLYNSAGGSSASGMTQPGFSNMLGLNDMGSQFQSGGAQPDGQATDDLMALFPELAGQK
ncbi:hypothetical protein K461DRAFT_287164 [Myriangium duriaei CBS 260.36]|uniref:C2H2-type domain-containing protein n=1 Tax=Myriangium duriaei CBS 260.36 TaxID=1168546 RepID=A0A9P4ML35_9PEZI|nr:hypothetical protein K461DRAFT_287164 [Myriangium duriaei CBS 260.36]